MSSQSDISKRGLLLLLLFGIVIWFGTLDYRNLIKPDEGRYAEISREMVFTGDWITPRLNGIKYFEKPPLQYWTTAIAFKAFGLNEWTARLWTALTGFLTVLLVGWAGSRLFGREAGLYAGLVLISNLYFVFGGHVNTLDMGLGFFTTAALFGFCFAQRDNASDQERKWGMLATWAAMAFAVLSKGLVGVVLPGATLVLYAIAVRDWTIWRRLYLLPGLTIFLAITLPWFIAVSIKNPEFPWFFFIHEHLLRYATPTARREGPIYYFAVILLIGMLPWIMVMLDALWRTVRALPVTLKTDKPTLILIIWTLFVFVFFSISSSKLPAYILPIFPSLSLLMGKRLAEMDVKELPAKIITAAPFPLIGFCAIFYWAGHASYSAEQLLYGHYSYWLYTAMAIMLAGIIYGWLQSKRGRKLNALIGVAVTGLLFSQLAGSGHQTLATIYSARDLSKKIAPYIKDNIPFYSVQTYDQTLPFYLRRTIILVNFQDEFSYGLQQEPSLAINDMGNFRQRWLADPEALALMQRDTFERLRAERFPMEVIVDDGKRIIIKKPKAIK